MKKTLVLNSHSLSYYQKCPSLFKFTNIRKITPREEKRPFERGTVISRMMEEYYRAKRSNELTKSKIFSIVQEILYNSSLEEEDKNLIEMRFFNYWKFYQNENWIVIAVEKEAAFSKVLYEDDDYLFIYEGTPDLVAEISPRERRRFCCDHKHQSRKTDIYVFNNQVLGYCWGTNCNLFTYNIFSVIESGKPSDWFRRPTNSFNPAIIQNWVDTTIRWYFKIVNDTEFLPSLNCESKYGVCSYHKICEQPLVNIQEGLIEREFKPYEYKSW